MKKLTVPLADLFLLLGLLVFFALGAGVHKPNAVVFDHVHLSADGTILLNDERLDQFSRHEVDYALTVEIAERLHRQFRAGSEGNHIRLSVDGDALVGWNNRLVDVIYGIVEYELNGWRGFSYRVDDEPEILVEIGLHRQATQVTVDLVSGEGCRISVDDPKLGEQGLYLVTLGGGTMRVAEALGYVRSIFGPEARVGFEQRYSLPPPPKEAENPRRMERAYLVELNAAGEMKINGKSAGSLQGFDKNHPKFIRCFMDAPPFEGDDWHYLIKVEDAVPATFLEDLLYVCGSYGHLFEPYRPPVFLQIGESKQYQISSWTLEFAFFKLSLFHEGKYRLVIENNWIHWPLERNRIYLLRAVFLSGGDTPMAVARGRFKRVFGPNAEIYQAGGVQVQATEFVVQ